VIKSLVKYVLFSALETVDIMSVGCHLSSIDGLIISGSININFIHYDVLSVSTLLKGFFIFL